MTPQILPFKPQKGQYSRWPPCNKKITDNTVLHQHRSMMLVSIPTFSIPGKLMELLISQCKQPLLPESKMAANISLKSHFSDMHNNSITTLVPLPTFSIPGKLLVLLSNHFNQTPFPESKMAANVSLKSHYSDVPYDSSTILGSVPTFSISKKLFVQFSELN